jgi:hypothetical protein
MTHYSIAIQKEWDVDGAQFVCAVFAHRKGSGLPDSVHLELRFDTAEDVAIWVEEAADAWL